MACRRAQLNSMDGFSLVEIISGLALMAIILSMAGPAFKQMKASIDRGTAIGQTQFDISRARSEALAKGTRTILTTSADGSRYTFGYDTRPYNSPASADTQIFAYDLPSTIRITPGQKLIFDSRGFLTNEAEQPINLDLALSFSDNSYCAFSVMPTGATDFACRDGY